MSEFQVKIKDNAAMRKKRGRDAKALFPFVNREIQAKKANVSRETFAFLCCVVKTAKNIYSKASDQAM